MHVVAAKVYMITQSCERLEACLKQGPLGHGLLDALLPLHECLLHVPTRIPPTTHGPDHDGACSSCNK